MDEGEPQPVEPELEVDPEQPGTTGDGPEQPEEPAGEPEYLGDSSVISAGPVAPVKRPGRPPRWTRESAIAAVQAYAAEHGHPPGLDASRGNLAVPSVSPAKRLFGSWPHMIEESGFERPVRGKQYGKRVGRTPRPKDSPGEGAAAEETPRSPTPPERAPVAPEPLAAADPPPALNLRAALLGVLDSLCVLVETLLPEERG
jgi:hypothetical protein